jgi:hypothetical protein
MSGAGGAADDRSPLTGQPPMTRSGHRCIAAKLTVAASVDYFVARPSSGSGTAKPTALAVLRLIENSYDQWLTSAT